MLEEWVEEEEEKKKKNDVLQKIRKKNEVLVKEVQEHCSPSLYSFELN